MFLVTILSLVFFSCHNQGKGVLIAVTLAAAGIICAVHYDQVRQQTEMKKGIERDRQRVETKRQQATTTKVGGKQE